MLLEAGNNLLRFVTALVRGGAAALDAARSSLLEVAGPASLMRAAAVAGNFQMMNRLVDATGVPVGASMSAVATDLGLDAN